MKSTVITVLLLILSTGSLLAQEVKKDTRNRISKEDPYNMYEAEKISKTDLLKAFDYLGIRLFKFEVPGDNENSIITILAREFKDGEILRTDTIANYSNEYTYWETGVLDPFIDYVGEFTMIANTEENKSELQFDLGSFTKRHTIELERNEDDQFYLWRKHRKTHHTSGQEIPLLIFASS